MRIAFGADDENECTRAVVDYLREAGELQVLSGGSWPEFARAVGAAVASGEAEDPEESASIDLIRKL
jgi:ribose 5-phosphate isomerase B